MDIFTRTYQPWGLYSHVFSPNLVKHRSRKIECYNNRIDLKCDSHLDSAALELPVKFQSDRQDLNPNPAALRLHEILL